MGATTVMTVGFTAREEILRLFEAVTGLRMNHAYIRPGGVAVDIPEGFTAQARDALKNVRHYLGQLGDLMLANPIFKARLTDVGALNLAGCMALGITGPVLRSTGLPYDVRKAAPYCGYETYEFDVPTGTGADCYTRAVLRLEECYQSLRIVEQALDRWESSPEPVMIDDPKVGWPVKLSVGPDGIGNDPAYLRHIMEESMEALIHHFKMVTQGVRVPAGEVYQAVESPRGELGYYIVSDGEHRPYRVKIRDPSFVNLQATPIMVEGGLVADAIAAIASIDPVMGGVDR
jgi:NADH-quinone oxidoreductase subunit D